jgi:hypothetical protein
MRQKSGTRKEPAEKVVRDIRRATRKQYSAEESEPVNATGPRERANGDHPAGRAIPSAGAPDAGADRRAPGHVLPLVRPLSDRWARGAGGPISEAGPRLEPHP